MCFALSRLAFWLERRLARRSASTPLKVFA
jgi:hypothetical protein